MIFLLIYMNLDNWAKRDELKQSEGYFKEILLNK